MSLNPIFRKVSGKSLSLFNDVELHFTICSPVATVLIRRGCLKAGTHVLSGLSHAKVRRMNDSNGKVVPVALPGMAVTVSGWKILPKAGDDVLDGSENDIKTAILNRARRQELEALHQDVDAINSRRQQDRDLRTSGEDEAPLAPVSSGPLELKLIIKADVSGSAEAVRDALHGMGNAIARTQVIYTGVGEITESDVMMAKAANGRYILTTFRTQHLMQIHLATIVGFSVSASRSIQNNAVQNGVPVCTSDIIYRLVDDVRERVTALLPVIVETKVTGEATILQLFDIDLKQRQTMKIAGCRVTNGVVEKLKFARVLRNGDIVYDGISA
jgi:translation initiation factor IF-2